MSFLGTILRRKALAVAAAVGAQNAPLIPSGNACDCGERELYTCVRDVCSYCSWCERGSLTTWEKHIQNVANRRERQSKT